jgi:hypothetical protein
MNTISSQGGHSALVKMRLWINGSCLRISQMGPDFLFVDAITDQPPGNATIVLQVDESIRQWDVHLPNGISAGEKRVAIAAIV